MAEGPSVPVAPRGYDPDAADLDDYEDVPPLLLYRILHDEVRSRLSNHYRSLLSGLSVIGVIIAYALLSGEFVFLAVIPIVVAFLVVQTVRQLNAILYIGYHLARIEGAFVDEYPLFSWARQYGMNAPARGVERWGINWSRVPPAIVVVFALLGYLGSIYTAYAVWPPAGVDILVIGLGKGGLLVVYGVLTLLVVLAGYSFRLHQRALRV